MALTYLVRWISYSGQSFSSAIGRSREVTLLSLCSALIFPVLMMLILMDRGLEGLWYVTPSAALLTAAAAVAVYFLRIRHFMEEKEGVCYSEAEAGKTGKLLEKGHELIRYLLKE